MYVTKWLNRSVVEFDDAIAKLYREDPTKRDLVIELKCAPEKGGSAVGERAKIQPELDGRSRNKGAEKEGEREIWIQLPELIAPLACFLPPFPSQSHPPSILHKIWCFKLH